MCSQYTLFVSGPSLLKHFSISVAPENLTEQIDQKVMPYRESWVITKEDGQNKLSKMRFSLLPAWAKEERLKFSTHNARIETVGEKATWRGPFAKRHCIVPITYFVEPIYHNRFAGNMLRFFTPDKSILTAAGIFDYWRSPKNDKEIYSFAILTRASDGLVKAEGHDRTPIFLSKSAISGWLDTSEERISDDWLNYLNKNTLWPDLECEIDRPMKAGWEKRI